jgi:lipopolysaccharide transport system ATP-binding protein
MSDVVIRVERLGKQFTIRGIKEHYKTLRASLSRAASAPFRTVRRIVRPRPQSSFIFAERFWALKEVSFEVKHGEVLGVIGQNGAGKSTLFKILSRITEPTEGYADIDGRVGSLLEVGTGFHSELTGRENVYLNGAILGMRRHEIDRKFDEIVDFAEVSRFIDTPVKHYSSGMYLRLAFAVAAHLEPEILIVDEVLAVGDAAFQRKCMGKMSQVASEGRTVLFVSHNMSAVARLCHTALLLQQGRVVGRGDVQSVIQQYMDRSVLLAGEKRFELADRPAIRIREVAFTGIRILDAHGKVSPTVNLTQGATLEIQYRVTHPVRGAQISFRLWNSETVCVLTSTDFDSDLSRAEQTLEPGDYVAVCLLPGHLLRPGSYWVDLVAVIPGTKNLDEMPQSIGFEVLDDGSIDSALGQHRLGVIAPILEWHTHRIA